ncbi:MAG: universal stress protein [Dehalococcoidia bacterium]|nr:universal stress protein [Dehalococcoidia bacterium]
MRILITSDGSQLAERAFAALAPWVQRWGAETWLLTVVDPRESHETLAQSGRPVAAAGNIAISPALGGVSISRTPSLSADRGQALEAARTATEDALRELAARYLPGIEVQAHAAFSEDGAESIIEFAREHGVDFVVMSTHGRSGLGRAMLGSVASSVVRHSTVPVIVIGPEVGLPGAA